MLKIHQIPDINGKHKFVNDDYSVSINGSSCQVRSCTVSAMPFNRVWPGHQRNIDQTEQAAYILFASDETVNISVKCRMPFDKACIRPISRNIQCNFEDDIINFTLKESGQYVLEPYNDHFALHIFFNPVKEHPDKEKATYYFGKGVHCPGVIYLRDNDSVFIDEEAVVFGTLFSEGAENVRIYGGGVVDSSYVERAEASFREVGFADTYQGYNKGNIRFYNSKNLVIEDIILLNSPIFSLSMFDCDNVIIDNVKILGQWRYNTDGIDILNTSNVLIKDCFVRSFDDTICVKGIYNKDIVIENVKVQGCVLWCGWGRTCEIGLETAVREIRNITFANCDLIHNSACAMDIQNGNYAEIHDILFENIHVEYQDFTQLELLQASDDMQYSASGKVGVPYLIYSDNYRFSNNGLLNISEFGVTHHITYKNINVYNEGVDIPFKIQIVSRDKDCRHHDFMIDGLYVNGEKMNDFDKDQLIATDNIENIEIQ